MGKLRIHVTITPATLELIENCKKEYLKNHKEMREIPISYNKIIYELGRFYINN